MRKHGFYPNWTLEEENIIRENIGKFHYQEIKDRFLPHRTVAAINRRASIFLGLSTKPLGRRFACDDNFWETPNETNCYWGGVMASDGSIKKQPKSGQKILEWSISEKDLGLMTAFIKDSKFEGNIGHGRRKTRKGNQSDLIKIGVTSTKWVDDLARVFNIVHQKTHILKHPNITDERLLACYLRGIVDGDGSIHTADNIGNDKPGQTKTRRMSISFVSSSKAIIDWIHDFCESKFTGEKHSFPKVQVSHGYSRLAISGQRAIQMFLYLSKLPTYCLDRKWKNPEVLKIVKKKLEQYPEVYAPFLDPIAHKFIFEEIKTPEVTG